CLLIYVLEGKNMKLSIEGTSGEIKELLQAIGGSKEQNIKIDDIYKKSKDFLINGQAVAPSF
ncbi:hypothetical protein, partial [Enterococcus faecium]|uniref:hypothetical protein n=2 Tax=Enterococcus faecium TaxID=1352 RepID=UPI001CA3107A